MKITVNNESIPEEAIRREIQSMRRQHLGMDETEAFKQVSSKMIDWTIIRQTAEQRIELSDVEVEKGLQDFYQSHGGEAAFKQRYNINDEQLPAVREDVSRQLKTRRLLEDLTKEAPPPEDDALRAYYEENRDEFEHPERVHAAHIVKHPKSEPAEQAAAEDLAAIRKRLLDGEDFLILANQVSECNDTPPDLGEFPRGQMVPEFEVVVFSMEPGEISPVFKTPFGLHIAKVFEKVDPKPMTFEECRDKISEQLWQDAKNDAIGEWVDAEKAHAEIILEEPE